MLLPRSKCRQCFFAQHLNHGNSALGVGPRDLRINSGIVKADFGSVGCKIAKINFVDVRPIDRSETHGAGFAGGIEITAPQFEAAKFLARLPDREHLGVRCGIVRCSDLIGSLRYDDAFFDDDGAERSTASGTDIVDRELNGAGHESVVHLPLFRHRVIIKGVPISATHESARKPVDMDSFAAAV